MDRTHRVVPALAMIAAFAACSRPGTDPTGGQVQQEPRISAHFGWDGGTSMQGPAEVHLEEQGGLTVRLQMGRGKLAAAPLEEEFSLSAAERKGLAQLVLGVDFFEESQPSSMATDIGETVLRITLDGRTRETRWTLKPNLAPLGHWFMRFVEQARLLACLRKDEDLMQVDAALDPGSDRVAQRNQFRIPLRGFIERTADPNLALLATGALARIEEPGPWGTIASAKSSSLDAGERFSFVEGLVIDGSVSSGRVDQEHRAALLPEVLAVCRVLVRQWATLDSRQRDRAFRLFNVLSIHQYEPAFEAFPEMAREAPAEGDPALRSDSLTGLYSFLYTVWGPPLRSALAEFKGPSEVDRKLIRDRQHEGALRSLEALAADPSEPPGVRARARDMAISLRRRP